ILTLLALEATIDATARGTVVGASGPLARADGSGPILVVDRQGAHRGAIGRGRVGLLVSPRNASGARAVAAALAQPHQAATFALTAEMVIADSSLASDLRRAGHDVAYGGIGQFDSAGLPERASELQRRSIFCPPRQASSSWPSRASRAGLATPSPQPRNSRRCSTSPALSLSFSSRPDMHANDRLRPDRASGWPCSFRRIAKR